MTCGRKGGGPRGQGKVTVGCSPLSACCTPSSYSFPILSTSGVLWNKRKPHPLARQPEPGSLSLPSEAASHVGATPGRMRVGATRSTQVPLQKLFICQSRCLHTLCLIHHTPRDLQVTLTHLHGHACELSGSVLSDSLWPHGLQPNRLLCL